MGAYIIRRILIALGMLIGASLLGFGVMKLTPGTYFDLLKMNPRISQEHVDQQIARYGLNQPVYVQYLRWLDNLLPFGFKPTESGSYLWVEESPAAGRPAQAPPEDEEEESPPAASEPAEAATQPTQPATLETQPATQTAQATPPAAGAATLAASAPPAGQPAMAKHKFNWPRFKWPNLGESFEHQEPVWDVITRPMLNTLLLNLVAIALTWLVALPLGIYAALNQHKLGDLVLSAISFVGMSLPGFFMALILLWLFAGMSNFLPPGGLRSATYDQMTGWHKLLDVAWHLIIPAIVLTIGGLAGLQRITRGNMLEVLRQQYVTTARAKGLPENRVIYRHALRNAINPLITIFGYELAALFSGAALLEIVLDYPGMGQLMFTAIVSKDEPLVMAGFMLGAILLLLGNLVADLLLAVADPRISYS
jgi:peptide/nickel transport system permease protein